MAGGNYTADMRRILLAVFALASAAVLPAVPACSSNGDTSEDTGDAAIPANQLEGQPCNPLLTSPCLPPSITCFSNVCSPEPDGGAVCVQILEADACAGGQGTTPTGDASADDAPATSSTLTCNSDLDCPISTSMDGSVTVAFVCGFSAFDGCDAVGVCLLPSPPRTLDGAIETGCGCDGESVAYVSDMYTNAPVQSPSPCPVDAGPSGEDAAPAVDASEDANPSPPLDASADASSSD